MQSNRENIQAMSTSWEKEHKSLLEFQVSSSLNLNIKELSKRLQVENMAISKITNENLILKTELEEKVSGLAADGMQGSKLVLIESEFESLKSELFTHQQEMMVIY